MGICVYTYDNRQGANYLTLWNYLFFNKQTLKRNFSGERPLLGISGFSVDWLCSPLVHLPASAGIIDWTFPSAPCNIFGNNVVFCRYAISFLVAYPPSLEMFAHESIWWHMKTFQQHLENMKIERP